MCMFDWITHVITVNVHITSQFKTSISEFPYKIKMTIGLS